MLKKSDKFFIFDWYSLGEMKSLIWTIFKQFSSFIWCLTTFYPLVVSSLQVPIALFKSIFLEVFSRVGIHLFVQYQSWVITSGKLMWDFGSLMKTKTKLFRWWNEPTLLGVDCLSHWSNPFKVVKIEAKTEHSNVRTNIFLAINSSRLDLSSYTYCLPA